VSLPAELGAGSAYLGAGDPAAGQFDDLGEAKGPVGRGVDAEDE
jgi:hypothetical protein